MVDNSPENVLVKACRRAAPRAAAAANTSAPQYLPDELTEEGLRDLFIRFGPISRLKLVKDHATGGQLRCTARPAAAALRALTALATQDAVGASGS
jgi:hypothetical protein